MNDKSKKNGKFQSISLPILSKEKQSIKELPISKQHKLMRKCAKYHLLDASWKIELNPRDGRDYNDSMYVSRWGSSYWSFPKAWNSLRQILDGDAINSGRNYGSV